VRLPAGRGCTQFLPLCTAQDLSGSRCPVCPRAAAPPVVAAPSWELEQQKCNTLLSHSSALPSRNVEFLLRIANPGETITLWLTEQVAGKKPDKTYRRFVATRAFKCLRWQDNDADADPRQLSCVKRQQNDLPTVRHQFPPQPESDSAFNFIIGRAVQLEPSDRNSHHSYTWNNEEINL
jgi:hypothetical protein